MELSFQTGAVILVYGDMDEDGFYMGELDGVRGLVPSNFLTEAPDQYNNQGPTANSLAQRSLNSAANRGRGIGPGARGPPPPPRDNMGGMGGLSQRGPQRKGMLFASFSLHLYFVLFSFIFSTLLPLIRKFYSHFNLTFPISN